MRKADDRTQVPAHEATNGNTSSLPEPSEGRGAENSLQSLVNGVEVLQLLARDSNLTLTDIANRLVMNKTVVYRVLSTLHQMGLVRRNVNDKRYRLGLRLWELGTVAMRDLRVRELAVHHLTQLAEQTGEAVNLSVPDDGEVLFLESVRMTSSGVAQTALATRYPLHCSAAGKVMLAYRSEGAVDAYGARGLVTATAYTITSPQVLQLEIAEIRAQGFAVNRGEWHVESCGIAVPLRDQSGEAIAAIGIACHASRFSDGFVRRVSDPALIHAREISRALGYKEPSVPWLAFS
ncbi:MAG: IclR family transcriptional regulator [Dehalococcoidia bacterium]